MNEDNLENTENLETHASQGDTSAEAPEDFMSFTITNEDREKYKRLDQYLTESAEGYSRTFLKNLFVKEQSFYAASPACPIDKFNSKPRKFL